MLLVNLRGRRCKACLLIDAVAHQQKRERKKKEERFPFRGRHMIVGYFESEYEYIH